MCSIMGYDGKDIAGEEFKKALDATISRGPDDTRIVETKSSILGFHRLAIMGLTAEGMQPFSLGDDYCVCNGEIYCFRPIKEKLKTKYIFKSDSDCEIILPLYREMGLDMFKSLDSEFALVIYDSKKDSLIAGRDPIGIRPLFYGYSKSGKIAFASEAKNLMPLCDKVMPFPPGHYYADGEFVRYADPTAVDEYVKEDLDTICKNIHDKLVAGIEKRLDSDAPLGFLLSGGLEIGRAHD